MVLFRRPGASPFWIVGNRLYYNPAPLYSAGWMLNRDQILALHNLSNFFPPPEWTESTEPEFDPRLDASGYRFWGFIEPLLPFYDAGVWVHHMTNKYLFWKQVPRLLSHIEDKMRCLINGTSCEPTIRFFCPIHDLAAFTYDELPVWMHNSECKLTA